jgi:hypothetical protein
VGTLRRRWFDVLLIVLSPPLVVPSYLQATRSLRVVRLLRLLRLVRIGAVTALGFRMTRRLLRHKQFHYFGLVAVLVVGLGATGLFFLEGDSNPSVLHSATPSGGPSSRQRPWATAMSRPRPRRGASLQSSSW